VSDIEAEVESIKSRLASGEIKTSPERARLLARAIALFDQMGPGDGDKPITAAQKRLMDAIIMDAVTLLGVDRVSSVFTDQQIAGAFAQKRRS